MRSLYLLILMIACIGLLLSRNGNSAAQANALILATQDPASLDRRITMLEQRINFIDNNIRRLEQQALTTTRPEPPAEPNRVEMDLLRRQIETLRTQLGFVECGIAKLDERTLSAKMKESRRNQDSYQDPCRLTPESPVQLPTRP